MNCVPQTWEFGILISLMSISQREIVKFSLSHVIDLPIYDGVMWCDFSIRVSTFICDPLSQVMPKASLNMVW